MSELTHLSLFSGIGGLDLAAEAAGFVTVGQCEWADYPTKILEKHWPDVPRWRDIRTLTKESFYEKTGLRTVDIISGGFPCQPFSVAGKQKAKEDDRYLWPEMLRVIRELSPRWVVGENVPGIIRLAAWDVVSGLEREGFDTVVFDFEAAAVGALHRRERIAFVGNRDSASGQHPKRCVSEKSQYDTSRVCQAMSDAGRRGLSGIEWRHDGFKFENSSKTMAFSTARDYRSANSMEHLTREGKTKNHADQLANAVKLFPTPTRFDASCGDLKGKEYVEGRRHSMKLIQAATLYPTQRAQSSTGSSHAPNRQGGADLQTVVSDSVGSGQLNPTWVEWLMGFPIGWTDLSASETR